MDINSFEEKKYCCSFTGHRKIEDGKEEILKEKLREKLIELIEKDVYCFLAGGALGFDTIAATTVLSLKKEYSHIKLYLILPCKNQTASWNSEDRYIYEDIKEKCDGYLYSSESYFRGCMHKRNRALADMSDYLICYLTEDKGGTAYTVNYAKEKNKIIYNIAKKAP